LLFVLIAYFFISFCLNSKYILGKECFLFFSPLFIYSLIYFLSYFWASEFDYYTALTIFGVCIGVSVLPFGNFENIFNEKLFYFFFYLIIVNIGFLSTREIATIKSEAYCAFFPNTNIYAGFLFFLFVISYFLERKVSHLYLIIYRLLVLFCIIFAFARSIYISVVIFISISYSWKFLKGRKYIFYLLLFANIGVLLVIILVSMHDVTGFLENYSDISIKYTGARLNSGRDILWPQLISAIIRNPILGYGAGGHRSILYSELSSHNFYLQTLTSVGILGLSFLILFFKHVYDIFWYFRNEKQIKYVTAFTTSILIQQHFEVFLTHNNIRLGLLYWFIISIGINYKITLKRI
jgi:O-antigen ligase